MHLHTVEMLKSEGVGANLLLRLNHHHFTLCALAMILRATVNCDMGEVRPCSLDTFMYVHVENTGLFSLPNGMPSNDVNSNRTL